MAQNGDQQDHVLADVWHAAEQRRSEEIGDLIKSLFKTREPVSNPVARYPVIDRRRGIQRAQ